MEIESGTDFLKQKYGLHNKPEVRDASERMEHRTDDKVLPTPEAQIQNYLDRFTEITERKDPDKRQRGLQALKHILHDKFVIKPDEIPDSYWEIQQRIAREQGHGDIKISDQMREQGATIIIADQTSSLDKWVDYLSTDGATYPDWLKYYAMRGVLTMGGYNKEKHEFSRRSKGTTKPFPDLDREALAYVLDAMEKHYSKAGINLEHMDKTDQTELRKLLEGANFAKLYAWALEKVTPAEENELLITEGEWVKYDRGSDPMPLVHSLQGHGTGWCTAGESTAKVHLEAGDFYVYYSYSRDELLKKRADEPCVASVPRAAIRMEADKISEVRGVAPEQNLDPYIADVVRVKVQEFPDGSLYEKKAYDMQMLTYVEKKVKAGHDLNKDDLIFLYEINANIEGFGYERDPRIAELRSFRDREKDASILFDCRLEDIARTFEEVNQNTKAYIGPLVPGIFTVLPENLEHIYTKFPEKKISQRTIEIGGKTGTELIKELEDLRFKISDYARDMLTSPEFVPAEKTEPANLIIVTVASIGFSRGATTAQIYAKAEELGLEICPAEVGAHFRLQYPEHEQPMDEWAVIAMKPITDPRGRSSLFGVERSGDGAWLNEGLGNPDDRWDSVYQFVFRRK